MGKWDPYSRRELRRLRSAYLRRNGVVIGVGFLGLIAFETAVIVFTYSDPLQWHLLGIAHAGLVAAALHLMITVSLAMDRDAVLHVRGP